MCVSSCVSPLVAVVVCSQLALRGQRQVEVGAVEEERPGDGGRLPLGLVQQLEQTRPDVHGYPHDDALGHSCRQGGRGGGGLKSCCC